MLVNLVIGRRPCGLPCNVQVIPDGKSGGERGLGNDKVLIATSVLPKPSSAPMRT
jgi:hypothetical protein